jgi:hypothetical protein
LRSAEDEHTEGLKDTRARTLVLKTAVKEVLLGGTVTALAKALGKLLMQRTKFDWPRPPLILEVVASR